MQEVVIAVVAAGVPLTLWGGAVLYGIYKKGREEHHHTEVELLHEMQRLVEAFGSTREYVENVPKLISGLIRVSRVQVEELQGLQATVKLFHTSMFPGEAPKAHQEYDEVAADREARVAEIMQDGRVSRDVAERQMSDNFDLGDLS